MIDTRLTDALAACNACELADADPDSPAGYCADCERAARRETTDALAAESCAYCGGDRGPVVDGKGYEACCAACQDGGPSAGRDYFGRDDLGPEGFTE